MRRAPWTIPLATALVMPAVAAAAEEPPNIVVIIPASDSSVTVTVTIDPAAPTTVPEPAAATPTSSAAPPLIATDAPAPVVLAPPATPAPTTAPPAPLVTVESSTAPPTTTVPAATSTPSTSSPSVTATTTPSSPSPSSTTTTSPTGTPAPTSSTSPSSSQQPIITAATTPNSTSTAAPAPTPAEVRDATHTADGITSTYHLLTNTVQDNPRGLVVYLDGDGQHGVTDAIDGYALGGEAGIITQAGHRGYPVLAPVAPGGHSWWADDTGDRNAAWVADLITKVRADTGLSQAPVWLVGYSGGAQLITQHLLPRHPQVATAGGGAIIAGGGGAPDQTPHIPAHFRLHYVTGQDDNGGQYNALADAQRGAAVYAQTGAHVTTDFPAGQDHDETPATLGRVLAHQVDAAPPQAPDQQPITAPIAARPSPASLP